MRILSSVVTLAILACGFTGMGKADSGQASEADWINPEGRITSKSRLPKALLKRLRTTTPRIKSELDAKGKNGIKNYKFKVAAPDEKAVIPLRELAYSAENIRRIRAEALKNKKLQPVINALLKKVRPWLELTDEELKALVPAPDATIAAPTAGDPKMKKSWVTMCGQEFLGRCDRNVEVCNIKRPGCIYSPNTKEWYGDEKPGEKYYDPGTGWVREDGRRFYFKGYWNLWVLIEMHRVMDNLALLYMLSGDELLARRALQILDLLSDLRKKRNPDTCYLGIYTKLPKPGKGYLAFNGNHANGRQILTAAMLDLLANSKYATSPSIANPDITIFESARRHYFQLFELGYLNRSLQNHALMLYGNISAQGVLFGYPKAVKLGIDSVFAYMDVCVYRDGDYYETADGYGRIGKRYIYQVMMPFNHYDSKRYDDSKLFPAHEQYPYNLKLGNSPIWFKNAVEAQFRMNIYGRTFRFGDTSPDRVWGLNNNSLKRWIDKEKIEFLRIFASQTEKKELREKCRELFDPLKDSIFAEPNELSIKTYGESQWFYLAEPEKKKDLLDNSESILTPGRLLIALKSGKGKNERAVFSRGGVPTSHGHDDQMGIQLYGRTGCMTGFYGYGRGGTARPDFFGYSVKAISHQMAIINEDIPKSYLFKRTGTAADVLSFFPVAPAQCFELSNPRMWKYQRGKEYRRLVWLIDVNENDFYMFDVFRLGGGSAHDYIRFAPYMRRPNSKSLKITGFEPKAFPRVWSMVGFNRRYKNAVFNKPGKSWGERMMLTGYMKDLGIKSEKKLLKKPRWNPAPGNGYGFVYDVKGAEIDNDWLCEWQMPEGVHYRQRLYMLNYDGQIAIRAKAPTSQHFSSNYEVVVARRHKGQKKYLRSRFAAVSELAKPGSWAISKVKKADVKTDGNPEDVVAVWIELKDGRKDLIISSAKPAALQIGDIKFVGQRAFLRFKADGKLELANMEASSELSLQGLSIKPQKAVWKAKVTKTVADTFNNQVIVDRAFPECLSGSTTLFDYKGKVPYTHNDYYKLQKVNGKNLKFGDQSLVGIKLEIKEVGDNGMLKSRWPMELAGRFNVSYFIGRRITSLDGKRSGIIVKQKTKKDFMVKPANLFKAGEKVIVWTVKSGDSVSVPSWVQVKSSGDEYQVKANTPLQLTLPSGKKCLVNSEELIKGTVKAK